MRTGAVISALLHIAALTLVIFGLPSLMQPSVMQEQPIVVELVDVGDTTTPQKKKAPEQKAKPEPEPEKKPEPPAEKRPR